MARKHPEQARPRSPWHSRAFIQGDVAVGRHVAWGPTCRSLRLALPGTCSTSSGMSASRPRRLDALSNGRAAAHALHMQPVRLAGLLRIAMHLLQVLLGLRGIEMGSKPLFCLRGGPLHLLADGLQAVQRLPHIQKRLSRLDEVLLPKRDLLRTSAHNIQSGQFAWGGHLCGGLPCCKRTGADDKNGQEVRGLVENGRSGRSWPQVAKRWRAFGEVTFQFGKETCCRGILRRRLPRMPLAPLVFFL